MRRRYIAIVFTILISTIAQAQEPVALSLNDCMEYALKHNYTIKNAQVDVLIQHIQNNETLSASYPHINGKIEIDNFYVPQQSFIDASTFPGSTAKSGQQIVHFAFTLPYGSNAGFTASQLIFDGAVFVAWKARKTVMEFAMQNEAVTEEGVRYNVFKAYNSLVIAYRQYDIIKQSLSYARSLEHDLEVTRSNGFAEKIDVERTSVQVNNLATDSIRIGNLLVTSEQLLKYQIGMDINKPIILTDTLVEERRNNAFALLNEQQQYDRVPEYIAINTSLRLNEYNLKRYQLSALPSINAFWGYGLNYGAEEFSPVLRVDKYLAYSTIGVQLNLPIFNGALRVNQVI